MIPYQTQFLSNLILFFLKQIKKHDRDEDLANVLRAEACRGRDRTRVCDGACVCDWLSLSLIVQESNGGIRWDVR